MKKTMKFSGVVLGGHKAAALEVPFDPREQWQLEPVRLRPGRHGHAVAGTINGVEFRSYVVPRMRRFWLELDEDLLARAKVNEGDTVKIALAPA
jgi:hypothetical protein